MSAVQMTVTVDDEHIVDTPSIADALTLHGFHVERVSSRAGAIFGRAEPETAKDLLKLEGVQDVRSSYEFQAAPMDPAIPQ